MKLVLHIVRKDLRKLRWPLAGWLLTVALNLALAFALVGGVEFGAGAELERLSVGLRLAGYALTFVIAAMLVQEDALVGSNQFWPTRPISAGRLLAAKLAGWLLLLVLPQLGLTLPWWITCTFGARDMTLAALEIVVIQAAVALPAALVASLTDTLSRFLVWAFVFVFSVIIIPGTLSYWLPNKFTERDFPLQTLAGWAAFAVVVAVVIVGQFLQRDTRRALVRLGVGAVLAPVVAVVAGLLLTPWLASRGAWREWQPERTAGVTVAPLGWRTSGAGRPPGNEVYLNTFLAVRGLPPDWLLAGRSGLETSQSWSWVGGPVVTRESMWINPWVNAQPVFRALLRVNPEKRDEETERYLARQNEERRAKNPNYDAGWRAMHKLREGEPAGVEVTTLVMPSTVARMRQAAPAYAATVRLEARRPEVWAEAPLLATGWMARHGHGWRVVRTEFGPPRIVQPTGGEVAPHELRLHLVGTAPLGLMNLLPGRRDYWDNWRSPSLVSFNREGGDLRWGSQSGGTAITVGSVQVRPSVLTLLAPVVRRGDKGVVRDPKWFEGARLALVGYREEARFAREVRAERFQERR
ncbi:MAG: hypothetical protein HZA93_00985 [Verrucomicrobia bacterium]|nr:hypothetical protein [Verrucomicrobiota bacterium]